MGSAAQIHGKFLKMLSLPKLNVAQIFAEHFFCVQERIGSRATNAILISHSFSKVKELGWYFVVLASACILQQFRFLNQLECAANQLSQNDFCFKVRSYKIISFLGI